MLLSVITLLICAGLSEATDSTITYDRYTGEPASEDLLSKYDQLGVTATCTMQVAECDVTERRRVDGSCNSLEHPVTGTYFEPLYRVLPAHYYNGSYSRKAADGSELQMPRRVRTRLLPEGKSADQEFTQAMPGCNIFTFGDIGSIHDILFYLRNKTDCCTEEGKKDYMCTPNIIPEDDPVHRFSGVRCMNLTRPLTYSYFGCTMDPVPSPIQQATGVFDLSHIYNAFNKGDEAVRSYEGGKLAVDIDEHGIVWPPNGNNLCALNQAADGETRCFGNYATGLLSVMLFSIWYLRNHNNIATQLAAVNPCWDDETLFQTARDINIAFAMQVYYYDYLPAIIGRKNLIKAGVISKDDGHRDVFDKSYPQVSLEFTYALRWFHTVQGGAANMYAPDGTFLKEYPYVNLTTRPGFLGVNQNIVYLTQHMYRQPAAQIGMGIDPDLAELGFGGLQYALDIPTSDLHKSRLLGFAPYIDYLQHFTGHKVTTFEDLEQYMKKEKIEQLKYLYACPEEIDLMAGLWCENPIEGGSIPTTLAYLMTEYLEKNVRSDRHWYERCDRPYAFTSEQLAEIRKATLPLLLCTTGDKVSEVQPNAFRVISKDNPLTPCDDYPSIDFTAWSACSA